MRKLRIGLVGCGHIAQEAFLPILTTNDDVEIVGVVTRGKSRWDEINHHWPGLPLTTEINALLEEKVDAAFVLTRVENHFKICSFLLKNRIHVFVEKPPTETAEETRLLAEMAVAENRVFMVGFNRRYAALIQYAKSLFSEVEIKLCLLEKHRPGMTDRLLPEAYREDLIHQIDLMRYLCGDVQPTFTESVNSDGQIVSSVSVVHTPAGGLGILTAGREAGVWDERVTLIGAGKTLRLNLFKNAELFIENQPVKQWSLDSRTYPGWLGGRGFQEEIEHFLDCIRTHQVPLTDGKEAYQTHLLQEALVAQWKNGLGNKGV